MGRDGDEPPVRAGSEWGEPPVRAVRDGGEHPPVGDTDVFWSGGLRTEPWSGRGYQAQRLR